MAKINLVMVSYNCGADIVVLLHQLKKGELPVSEINVIVVDNASVDDSVARLQAFSAFPIRVIASPRNLGFGAGCNLALPFLDGEKTLFLNPDVVLFPDSLSALLAFSEGRPQAGIWGGRTLNSEGCDDGNGAWREPTLLGLLNWTFFIDLFLKKFGFASTDAYKFRVGTDYIEADAISGCFFLIDTRLFKSLAGFDERFFMYSEEVDLCRRARALGARPISTSRAKIVHHGSQTLNSINKLDFLYFHKLKYYQKYWSPIKFCLARQLIRIAIVLRIAVFTMISLLKPSFSPQRELWVSFWKRQSRWVFK